MPRSFARRRASGEAFTRPPVETGASATGLGASGSGSGAAAAGAGSAASGLPFVGAGTATSSPAAPITATVLPTSTSPSWTRIRRSTPEASASTSCVTFSVSSS